MVTDDSVMADIINNHFSSCFNIALLPLDDKFIGEASTGTCPEDLYYVPKRKSRTFYTIDTSKASGPGGISGHDA